MTTRKETTADRPPPAQPDSVMEEEINAAAGWWAQQIAEGMERHNSAKRRRESSGKCAAEWSQSSSQSSDHSDEVDSIAATATPDGNMFGTEYSIAPGSVVHMPADAAGVAGVGGVAIGYPPKHRSPQRSSSEGNGGVLSSASAAECDVDGRSSPTMSSSHVDALPVLPDEFVKGLQDVFCASMKELLYERYRGHWYTDDPSRGSGYRAIISDQIQYDTILHRAFEMCEDWIRDHLPSRKEHEADGRATPPRGGGALSPMFLRFLPRNVIMFCNPMRVCVRQLGGARYYHVLNVYLKRSQSPAASGSSTSVTTYPASPMQPVRISTPVVIEADESDNHSAAARRGRAVKV